MKVELVIMKVELVIMEVVIMGVVLIDVKCDYLHCISNCCVN